MKKVQNSKATGNDLKQKALTRFLRYVAIDTQSQDDVSDFPSTKKQFNLARLLVKELHGLGIKNARVDKYGYVTATIPKNSRTPAPKIGLIAHLDTSPEVSGKDVRPRIIKNYQGGDIVLDKKKSVLIRASECKELRSCIGHTIVTTDGTTLLGGDDKAGVAAIMTVAETLTRTPSIPHGDVLIAFTPDEETGRGVDFFDVKKFGADFAYTIDGGCIGELNRETFSADSAKIEVVGRDIHPGTAKNVMVNSIRVMADIIARLPKNMAPETTEGYEPYIHPISQSGSVGNSTLKLLFRDFKDSGLLSQKKVLEKIIKEVQALYPKAAIKLTITPSYRNMRGELEKHPEVTDRLWDAAKKAGLAPFWEPIRGGTDGSRLTAMGLPTPNIFTGSANHHSVTEWLSADQLAAAVHVALNAVTLG